MTPIRYRPEIDGLRAFAVIPVILFHMGFSWIAGGFVGVDVFFVISGFLITSIVLQELEAGTFSLRGFWMRRIRRILPAMMVMTAATVTAAFSLTFPPDRPVIGWQAVSALLSVANIYFWRTTGNYWGTRAEESPFLHMWSLSVEEQFYLAFPLVIWLFFRFRPTWLKGVLLLLILASVSLFLWGASTHPTMTFYLLPTRAWELGIGCLLALMMNRRQSLPVSAEVSRFLAAMGLCMILGSCLFLSGLNAGMIFPVLGTALVIGFGQTGWVQTLLAQQHIVQVGQMSYSLYLWHWPVLVFADAAAFSVRKVVLLIPILLLSILSYQFVERPTRRRAAVMIPIAKGYLVTAGLAVLLIYSSQFVPASTDMAGFEQPLWIPHSCLPYQQDQDDLDREWFGRTQVIREEVRPDAYLNGGVIVGSGVSDPAVVVLGDSHGCMWSDAIATVTQKLEIRAAFYCMEGVSPFVELPLNREQHVPHLTSEEKYDFDKSRLEYIARWQPELVIICCRWSVIREREVDGFLEFLKLHAGKVLLMEQPPELAAVGSHNVMNYLAFRGVNPRPDVQQYLPLRDGGKRDNDNRSLVRRIAERFSNCHVLPVYDLFERDGQAVVLDGRNIIYLDDNHLVSYGARLALSRFVDVINQSVLLDSKCFDACVFSR